MGLTQWVGPHFLRVGCKNGDSNRTRAYWPDPNITRAYWPCPNKTTAYYLARID